MAKKIESFVEVWNNPYTSKTEKFPSIRKAILYAKSLRWQVSGSIKHFIGVRRSDKKGYIYMTY